MALPVSLVLSGDGEGAERALRGVTQELDRGEKGAEAFNRAAAASEASIKKLANAQAIAQRETRQSTLQYKAGEISLEQYNRELLQTKTRLGLVEAEHRQAANALKQANMAIGQAVGPTRQARAGYQQLGQQMQDVAVMAMMPGTNIGQIVAMQGGQVATAVQMMGGRFSGLAGFIAGPYGAAILVATSLGANLIQTLLETEPAADAAASGAYAYADSLHVLTMDAETAGSAVRKLTDDLRAAIIVQGDFVRNQALVAQRERQNVEARLRTNQEWLKDYERRSSGMGATLLPQLFGPSSGDDYKAGKVRAQIKEDRDRLTNPETGLIAATVAGRIATAQRNAFEANDPILKIETDYKERIGRLNQRFETSLRSSDDPLAKFNDPNFISEEEYTRRVGRLTAEKDAAVDAERERQRKANEKPKREGRGDAQRQARELQRLTEWGDRAAESIARISERFGEQPTLVVQVNQATRELDDTIADLERRKPPGFADMIADAQAAKDVVREALVRPFTEMREESERRQQIDLLLLAGKEDQAAVVQEIWRMEEKIGPLNREQREQVEEIVLAEQEHLKLLEKAQELQSAYLDTTRGVRSEIEAIFAGRGNLGNFQQMFRDLKARVMVEQIFGPAFQEMEDYVTENTALPGAIDVLATEAERAGSAAGSLADVLVDQARRIADPAAAAAGPSQRFEDAFAGYGQTTPDTVTANEPIVVTGRAGSSISPEQYFERMARTVTGPILDGLDETFGVKFFSQLQGAVASAFYGYATAGTTGGVLGFASGLVDKFGSDIFGAELGKEVSQGLMDALGGAQQGTMVAGIGNALGIKMSTTGSQIGGALGSFIPIPGGAIIGSIAGGFLGNLFSGKEYGTAQLSSGKITPGRGKGDGRVEGATTLAGAVEQGIARIIEELGAEMGSYRVSIGTFDKSFRVSRSGYSGSLNSNNLGSSDLAKFSDEKSAIQFAIADAIGDGAVAGISAAVQKALRSSPDIDKAIEEALAVSDLEKLLLDASDAWREELRQFEETARERVDLARRYGLDLVKVEELNAEQRLKLTETLLEEQVGSLQSLVEQMTTGNMFEGSAVDRRDALLADIAETRAAAQAGEEGAADRLAELLTQLNQVSAEVYGSTGGFASDRSMILDTARTVIAEANRRLEEGSAQSDPALAETNASLDENNDQNAQIIDRLDALRAVLEKKFGGGSGGIANAIGYVSELARTS